MKLQDLQEARYAHKLPKPVEQVIAWLDSDAEFGPLEPEIHQYPIMDIYHSLVDAFGRPDEKSERGESKVYAWRDRGKEGERQRDVQLLIWPGLHRLAAYHAPGS